MQRNSYLRWFGSRAGLAVSLGLAGISLGSGAAQDDPAKPVPPAKVDMLAPPDVAAPPANALKTGSGVAMIVLEPGSGTEHPTGDDCVNLVFTAWKRDGSLFSTSGPHGEPEVQCLITAIPGISEALKLMVTGEKRRVWVPSDLAFAAHIAHHGPKELHADPVPKVDLTVDVRIIRILKAPVPPVDFKPPSTAFRTPSGVVFQVLTPGAGTTHPTTDSRVTVNYSGWTMDRKLFESTIMSGHPTVVLVGMAVPGWRDVLPRMVTGEKVRIWIPAGLAYGEHPIQRGVPAGSLVYDLELLDFK
jgi:peptidylprolyl isomerase